MSSRQTASSKLSGPRRPPDIDVSASDSVIKAARRRSNSQSQVSAAPSFSSHETPMFGQKGKEDGKHLKVVNGGSEKRPQKRRQGEFYVTLVSLNDTFVTKHIHVPYYPETCKLGRPTGAKVKPHTTNGYFDSRVLSRNHACMYINAKSGQLMVRDTGSSNGTFVNQERLDKDPVAVNEGDIINLGFNIQVETSHKQISARIERIHLVSNNPVGAVHQILPGLTSSSMNSFSEADMQHYEFIQELCTQLVPSAQKETAAATPTPTPTETEAAEIKPDTNSKKQELKAFDHGMFSDIVPSLGEIFETSANFRYEDMGLYKNSGIQASPELLTTLDYLSVNLAKAKQQNATLRSLEAFFSKYAKDVDAINSLHVRKCVKNLENNNDLRHKIETENNAQLIREQDAKLSVQSRLVMSLEEEIAALKLELKNSAILTQGSPETNNVSESEHNDIFDFTYSEPPPQLSSSDDEKTSGDASHNNHLESSPMNVKELAKIPCCIPGEFNANGVSIKDPWASEHSCTNTENHENKNQSIGKEYQPLESSTSYSENLHQNFYKYKYHGALVGVFVVIAGLIFQKTKSG